MDSIKNKSVVVVALLLALLTLATYWQVMGHDFVNFDDEDYVVENHYVRGGLTLEGVRWAFTTGHASNWHPLTWLSHMLDVQLYGLRPWGHHLTSLLFHIVNTVLLFLVLLRMTKALWPSALVAALFALHPLHVESVAWVAERKDVLSAFFWVLTLGAYGRYVEHPVLKRYLLALLLFVLGLMAKPMLVTMPVVLLLLDYWPLHRVKLADPRPETLADSPTNGDQRAKKKKGPGPVPRKPATSGGVWSSNRSLLWEKVPFLVFTILSSAITLYSQRGALSSLERLALGLRLENALTAYVHYIGKTIWPMDLSPYYPHPGSVPIWEVLGAAAILATASFLVFQGGRRWPYLVSGWLWYLVTLTPVIGIVQVGGQRLADRYTYIPQIGLLIMLAWGLPEVLKGWRRQRVALALLSGLCLVLATVGSWRQVGYWRDTFTLFGHALEVTENNALAHGSLGKVLHDQGRQEEAILHLTEAIRINPKDPDFRNNLGLALQARGLVKEAMASFSEALRLNPNHARAHSNMGDLLFNQGQTDEAATHYDAAIRLSPDFISPYVNMGGSLASQGRYGEAMTFIEQGLRIEPESPDLRYILGSILAAQGRMEEAAAHFQETVRLKPDHAEAYNDLGGALLLQGKIDEAIGSFRESLRLKPGNEQTQKNLDDALEMKRGGAR